LKELPKVYFEKLLESSPDIIVAVDRDGRVIFYNDGAKRTLGYTAEEVLGRPVEVFYPSREEAARVMSAMRSADHSGAGFVKNFETQFVNRRGETVPVAISGTIIYDPQGREQGSIGFAKDITVLRHHEQMETLGQLAIGLAHEINNPLEALVNNVELFERYLKEHASSEDYAIEHTRIEGMKRELRRIQGIVERVGEIAASGDYGTVEYLPGRLMTNLGATPGAAEPPEPYAARTGGTNSHHRLEGKTILVVDDDPDVCGSMAAILGTEGCRIITARSGVEALGYVQRVPIDLVLSDVVMPDMDGYTLFREIRAVRPDLPVVLMTAYYYDKDHVIKRSKAEGLQDVIFKKPINPGRLLEMLDGML
jgi:PAS domain S-box-containing protein